MSKKKLQRFEEMKTFSNVLQPDFGEIFRKDHVLKGKWKSNFFRNDNPLILELGCGKGEYTTGLAKRYPSRNFIGIDIKGARIWKGAGKALSEGLFNAAFIRAHIEHINSFFSGSEVDEIWITFPDPQPNKARKRLTSPGFLSYYQKFLKDNGRVHLKTDNDGLFRYTGEIARVNNFNIMHETDDLHQSGILKDIPDIRTFYEQQFIEKGFTIKYLCFELPCEKIIRKPEES